MTVKELLDKRAKLWDECKKFLDEHTGEDGMMSAEDAGTYDRMEKAVTDMGDAIERAQRAEEVEKKLNGPTRDELKGRLRGGQADESPRGAEYGAVFWDAMKNGATPELRNALKEGTDANGGYLVPDEYERTLIKKLEEENIFRRFAHIIKTSGDRLIPVVETNGTASWIAEEAAYPESTDTFGQITLGAYKLATMIKISEELLSDSAFNMASYIAGEHARRIGAAEEEAFIAGNGTGRPTGVLTDASAGVTAASATAITFDEMFGLYHALRQPYRAKAVWLMNDSTVLALRKLKDGNQQYIWQPAVTAGAPDMILGRPVYTSRFMPTLAASAKVVLFGDMSYYWIADRDSRTLKRLNELYAATGQVGFQAMERVDGKLILPEAVKKLTMKAS